MPNHKRQYGPWYIPGKLCNSEYMLGFHIAQVCVHKWAFSGISKILLPGSSSRPPGNEVRDDPAKQPCNCHKTYPAKSPVDKSTDRKIRTLACWCCCINNFRLLSITITLLFYILYEQQCIGFDTSVLQGLMLTCGVQSVDFTRKIWN